MTTADLVKKYNHIFHTDYTADANCQAAYLFTEGAGTTVDDASANTNTGTFASSGNPAWDADVPAGGFAAGSTLYSSDYISVSDHASLEPAGDMSMVAWVKATSYGVFQVMAKDHSSGNARSYGLILSDNSGGLAFRVWAAVFKAGDTESLHNPTTGASGATNAWIHIAMVYDYVTDGTSVLETFINGTSLGTKTNCVGPIQNGTAQLRMGARQYTSFEGYFPGYITETAFFDRKLTSTEINEIKDLGLKPAGSPTGSTLGIMTTRSWWGDL